MMQCHPSRSTLVDVDRIIAGRAHVLIRDREHGIEVKLPRQIKVEVHLFGLERIRTSLRLNDRAPSFRTSDHRNDSIWPDGALLNLEGYLYECFGFAGWRSERFEQCTPEFGNARDRCHECSRCPL